eukprot:TRINITY_DN8353_c0_g1_i3.p1 TRINITY_DN8353_c0_g1~~TRINITY_DN8353_c0_g1_i3.p1  ORF type:complete len:363 (+),score=64.39 TRINITY_DN8353_c0_g1_i3:103-1191(+)
MCYLCNRYNRSSLAFITKMNDNQASDIDVEMHYFFQTFLVANSITDHITKLAFNCIYSKEVDKKRGEFTARDMFETLKGLVRSCHINTDQGEVSTAPAETNSWQPSEEPPVQKADGYITKSAVVHVPSSVVEEDSKSVHLKRSAAKLQTIGPQMSSKFKLPAEGESKVYRIVKSKANDQYEESVALSRMMKVKEESRRREEEAQMALAKKKLQEKNKFRKISREKGTISADYASYNFEGKTIDVNLITEFNELTTACNNRVPRPLSPLEEQEKPVRKNAEVTKEIPLINILAREAKFKEEIRRSNIPLMKLYDSFKPSPGVELIENGRKPKRAGRTFKDAELSEPFLPKLHTPDLGTPNSNC